MNLSVPVINLNFDDISQCLIDTSPIELPSPYVGGVWSGVPGSVVLLDGVYYFNQSSANQSSSIVYYNLDTANCYYIDSLNIYLPSNPTLAQFNTILPSCEGDSVYLIFPDTLSVNSLDTEYTITIYQGENVVYDVFEFNQSNLPDSLFFELDESSCGLNYTPANTPDNSYLITIDAFNAK